MRFETLIEQYHDEIYRYLWRLLPEETRGALGVDDLTQEIFLRAYRAFDRLRPGSNVRAWLYKIATNYTYTALACHRRDRQRLTDLLDESHPLLSDERQNPHRQAAHHETLAAVRQAILELPPKQRAALIMRHLQGLEYAEIAQVLECSEDSARAGVYQAIQRLRKQFAAEEME